MIRSGYFCLFFSVLAGIFSPYFSTSLLRIARSSLSPLIFHVKRVFSCSASFSRAV
nr:MAG TPA: hypothetical protein [Caudoviricetes sp.]